MLDCGASFSALNWQAAALAGLPPRGDAGYAKGPGGVAIIGMDGQPQVGGRAAWQGGGSGLAGRAGESKGCRRALWGPAG